MARSLKRQNEHGGTADSSDDLTYIIIQILLIL